MTPSENVVVVRDLVVQYGGRTILDRISLDIRRGEVLVLLGASGSGKSTLLRHLIGLERPLSGSITVKGVDINHCSESELNQVRRFIGVSFQNAALFGSMTVSENVAFPLLERTRLPDSTIGEIVLIKLAQVGMVHFGALYPSELSGGMLKRASIARATALDPEILFFDEPSAALDPIMAAGLDELVVYLKNALQMTILVVTHELQSAFRIADRLAFLKDQKLVAIGPKDSIAQSTDPGPCAGQDLERQGGTSAATGRETRCAMSKELKVGAFVLATLLTFLGTLVYVDQLTGVRVPYKTYFNYVGGVDPGSQVRFGGMKVGSITAIHQAREDPTKIEVLMEVKGGVPVNADSVATLTSLSPLGDKYLEISTGSNQARRLSPGATIPSMGPVGLDDLARQVSELIPTIQSTFQDMQKNIDQLTGNARTVLGNLQSMTSPQNQRNLTLLLASARDLLDKESSRIDTVLRSFEQVSLQASGTLDQANRTFSEIETTARTANDTFANANRTIEGMRDPIKTDLTELQRTMTEARRLIEDLNTVVSANRYNIDDTFENFRAASENLRELTASVRQRPWTLIRGKAAPDRAVPVVAGRR